MADVEENFFGPKKSFFDPGSPPGPRPGPARPGPPVTVLTAQGRPGRFSALCSARYFLNPKWNQSRIRADFPQWTAQNRLEHAIKNWKQINVKLFP